VYSQSIRVQSINDSMQGRRSIPSETIRYYQFPFLAVPVELLQGIEKLFLVFCIQSSDLSPYVFADNLEFVPTDSNNTS